MVVYFYTIYGIKINPALCQLCYIIDIESNIFGSSREADVDFIENTYALEN